MKKIKKLFFSLTLFGLYANIANATTKGTYVVSDNNNTGKELLVFIGIVLVALIIFIGYKLDKKDELKKRKEKYNKTDDYKSNSNKEVESQYLEDIPTEEKNFNSISDDTVRINYKELIELEKGNIENKEESYVDSKAFTEKTEDKYTTVEDIIDNNDLQATMIINSTENLKSQDLEETEDSEETEIDEDLELLELEKAIKDANIRKYTRKKKKVKEKIKRYTRKKIKEQPEVKVETKKRGRPPKIKTEETIETPKRGRGRPRKTETNVIVKTETKKRGRPPKAKQEKTVETPKRGRGRPRKK